MNDKKKVHLGKPKVGGAIYAAPAGSTLPEDATTALDAAFKCLGYISDDGVTNANSNSFSSIKAWGGDTVLTYNEEHTDTFSFTVIQTTDEEVLKFVFGSNNVTKTANLIKIEVGTKEAEDISLVIELVLRDGKAKRLVIPLCNVTEVGEITYGDSDAVGYETTVTALSDESGNTHYEYIQIGA